MRANRREPGSVLFWFQSTKFANVAVNHYIWSPAWRLYALGCSYNNSFAVAQLMHSCTVGSASRRAGAISSLQPWQ